MLTMLNQIIIPTFVHYPVDNRYIFVPACNYANAVSMIRSLISKVDSVDVCDCGTVHGIRKKMSLIDTESKETV